MSKSKTLDIFHRSDQQGTIDHSRESDNVEWKKFLTLVKTAIVVKVARIKVNAGKELSVDKKEQLEQYIDANINRLIKRALNFHPLKKIYLSLKIKNGSTDSKVIQNRIIRAVGLYLYDFKEKCFAIAGKENIAIDNNKKLENSSKKGIIKENDLKEYEQVFTSFVPTKVELSKKSIVLHQMLLLRRFIDEAFIVNEKFDDNDLLLIKEFGKLNDEQKEQKYTDLNKIFLSL